MIHRPNYFLTREFLAYLSEVMQLNPSSVGRYWSYMKHLLIWADAVPFAEAPSIRPTFTSYLAATGQDHTQSPGLAALTLKKILQTAKRFFKWLKSTYPQHYRHLSPAWIEALRLPRASRPVEEHEFVKLEQVLRLIGIPVADEDLASWRDQAGAAMLFLSGARATAFTTLTLECVDLPNRTLKQWAELGVKTKNGKSATTFLLEIPELLHCVERWDGYIRSRLPPTATWYTPILQNWGDQKLSSAAPGNNRNIALARRLRKLFALAQLPPTSPHAFRHGHAVFALQHCRTMADYKSVSMNLMHENIAITDGVYAPLASDEVRQRVAGLTAPSSAERAELPEDPGFVQQMTDGQLAAALTVAARRLSK